MLMEKMRAPDGGYEEGFTVPGTGEVPPRTEKGGGNLEKNNPLSLHDEVSLTFLIRPCGDPRYPRIHGGNGLLLPSCGRQSYKM